MSSSREKILSKVLVNQPSRVNCPEVSSILYHDNQQDDLLTGFITVATTIGARIKKITNAGELRKHLQEHNDPAGRMVTTISDLFDVAEDVNTLGSAAPTQLEDVEIAILKAQFGVAENGALWLTEHDMGIRVLPYINQHLVIMLNAGDIVPNMHTAYERNAGTDYGFAAFIAGPSKSADIEQSLVIGAHGTRSLTIFILH